MDRGLNRARWTRRERPGLRRAVELVQTLALTLTIFLVIHTFVAQPFQVKQQSMQPTLDPGQYVLVDKLTPRFDPHKRGDIVVFDPPVGWEQENRTPFIKRVIGVGGDEVEVREDGRVYLNGTALEEPYVFRVDGEPQPTTAAADDPSWIVPEGELFVMGDHRASSQDSRTFGPITVDSVIGRGWLRYWPLDAFGVLPAESSSMSRREADGLHRVRTRHHLVPIQRASLAWRLSPSGHPAADRAGSRTAQHPLPRSSGRVRGGE